MQNKKAMWIVIGCFVLTLTGGLCGWAVASSQKLKKYPFLSNSYNVEYIPTWAEWAAMRLTAINNHEEHLTDKLVKRSCAVLLLESNLSCQVDTRTQPSWNVHLGGGRFSVSDRELRAAYAEAAEKIVELIRIYFPEGESELSNQEIEISLSIRGSEVGVWRGGIFRLIGE